MSVQKKCPICMCYITVASNRVSIKGHIRSAHPSQWSVMESRGTVEGIVSSRSNHPSALVHAPAQSSSSSSTAYRSSLSPHSQLLRATACPICMQVYPAGVPHVVFGRHVELCSYAHQGTPVTRALDANQNIVNVGLLNQTSTHQSAENYVPPPMDFSDGPILYAPSSPSGPTSSRYCDMEE